MGKIECTDFKDKILNEVKQKYDKIEVKLPLNILLIKNEQGKVDEASLRYTTLKQKTANEIGVNSEIHILSEDECLEFFKDIKSTKLCILQLPAPKSIIDEFETLCLNGNIIDVDFFCKQQIKGIPATARACYELIKHYYPTIEDRTPKGTAINVAIIGSRSKTTGRPLTELLLDKNATLSLFNSKSVMYEHSLIAMDVIVCCTGQANLIDEEMLGKSNVICLDVGISFVDGKVVGDFNKNIRKLFNVKYTPYVNGIGLLTRVMLLQNYVDCLEYYNSVIKSKTFF